MIARAGRILLCFLLLCAAASAQAASRNFSQYPGFAEWYAANPPSDALPSSDDQALLMKHRPRFFLGDGQTGFIDFYRDYIAQGTLRAETGEVISDTVTPELLNTHKEDPGVVFTHEPASRAGAAPQLPKIFGRITRASLPWLGTPQALTFLTYNAVFAHSGLPGGLLGWQKIGLGLIGDLDDWHQLDHYTSVTVILDAARRPFAIMLQQHNYLQTYLVGERIDLPADGRPLIAVAEGSNELFPFVEGRTSHRAVPFLTPGNFRFMLGAGRRPLFTADDVTDPVVEADYQLAFLAPSDAFYTFKGFLGELRTLPGRDGPPGADYNTLPYLKPLTTQMLAGYWRYGNAGDIGRMEASFQREKYWLAFAEGQREVFFSNAACAKAWGKDCAFD